MSEPGMQVRIPFRLTAYEIFCRFFGDRFIWPRVFERDRRDEPARLRTLVRADQAPSIFWFHAASAGELESLWTLALEQGRQARTELVLTVFSPSARKAVQRLADECSACGAKVLYAGYSPLEGRWTEVLLRLRPKVFVTAKYEAWPDLWSGLALGRMPLVIVGAKARRSLAVAKTLCRWLGCGIPRVLFLTALEADVTPLSRQFDQATVRTVGDPRWDRVVERSRMGNPRARELVRLAASAPRPWGIFGSIWPEDFGVIGSASMGIPGTLWFVPHKVDAVGAGAIEKELASRGFRVIRSSIGLASLRTDGSSTDRVCILVDEMGFLSELYSSADWAYVGGGFTQGVHSTIEPAIHGIPVAAGPKRADRFPEISELCATGQLKIVRTAEDFNRWSDEVGEIRGVNQERKNDWLRQAQERMKATDRGLSALQQFL